MKENIQISRRDQARITNSTNIFLEYYRPSTIIHTWDTLVKTLCMEHIHSHIMESRKLREEFQRSAICLGQLK